MALPRPASPKVLIADLRAFLAQRTRHQLFAAVFAVAMPVAIVAGFVIDSRTSIAPREELIFVDSWPASRTDAQIIAQQKIDRKKKAEQQAERQRQYKELERRLGM
jgi:hypothetical protein